MTTLFRDLMVTIAILFLTLGFLYTLFLDYRPAGPLIALGIGFALLANVRP